MSETMEAALVEKVARAISLVDAGEGDDWDGLSPFDRDEYRRYARAALASLPPTDSTLREALQTLSDSRTGEQATCYRRPLQPEG